MIHTNGRSSIFSCNENQIKGYMRIVYNNMNIYECYGGCEYFLWPNLTN